MLEVLKGHRLLQIDDSQDAIDRAFSTFKNLCKEGVLTYDFILHIGEDEDVLIQRIKVFKPTILLLDNYLSMEKKGCEMVPAFKKAFPKLIIIGFSSSPKAEKEFHEADAFISKQHPWKDLPHNIAKVIM